MIDQLNKIILLPYYEDRKRELDHWLKENYREIHVEEEATRKCGAIWHDPVSRIGLGYKLVDEFKVKRSNNVFSINIGVIEREDIE
jgi:hypothetical protein